MTGVYELAGSAFCLSTAYNAMLRRLRSYRVQKEPDFYVHLRQDDIEAERERALETIEAANYSDAYYESLALHRQIAERLPLRHAFLFHGSALAVGGEGYVFTAPSGTGKSTHARLWREYLGDGVLMINDDKPFIRVGADRAYACGSPWDGKHHLSCNSQAPIRAICLIEQSPENWIRRISFEEAYVGLFLQTYRPRERYAMAQTLELLDALAERVALFRMGCNISLEAASMAYEAMRKETV